MFKVNKRVSISASHQLELPYESACSNLHGHNWIINVEVLATALDKYGMVIDFSAIDSIVTLLDHDHINDRLIGNPTAENIAHWVAHKINELIKEDRGSNDYCWVSEVTVQETEGNIATWWPEQTSIR